MTTWAIIAIFAYAIAGLATSLLWRNAVADLVTELVNENGALVGNQIFAIRAVIVIIWPIAWIAFGAKAFLEIRRRNSPKS